MSGKRKSAYLVARSSCKAVSKSPSTCTFGRERPSAWRRCNFWTAQFASKIRLSCSSRLISGKLHECNFHSHPSFHPALTLRRCSPARVTSWWVQALVHVPLAPLNYSLISLTSSSASRCASRRRIFRTLLIAPRRAQATSFPDSTNYATQFRIKPKIKFRKSSTQRIPSWISSSFPSRL